MIDFFKMIIILIMLGACGGCLDRDLISFNVMSVIIVISIITLQILSNLSVIINYIRDQKISGVINKIKRSVDRLI